MSGPFTSRFWKEYWVSLRRVRRDKTDRKRFLVTTGWLLFATMYYGGYLWGMRKLAKDTGTLLVVVPAAIVLLLVFGLQYFSNRHDRRIARVDSDRAVDQTLRKRLATDAFVLAIMLARNGSEELLRTKQLPDNLEIVTRRRQLDQLRSMHLWPTLPPSVRDLLLATDGHWQPNTINEWQCFEMLRCLRWVLRLDTGLTPLSDLPRLSGIPVHTVIDKPDKLLTTCGMQDIWDIRVERVAADRFFSRCYAELLGRGLLNNNTSSEQKQWAKPIFDRARSPEHRDLLVQHNAVGELDEPTLRYITSIAWHRYHALQSIMRLIDSPNDSAGWQEWSALCFPFSVIEESEA